MNNKFPELLKEKVVVLDSSMSSNLQQQSFAAINSFAGTEYN